MVVGLVVAVMALAVVMTVMVVMAPVAVGRAVVRVVVVVPAGVRMVRTRRTMWPVALTTVVGVAAAAVLSTGTGLGVVKV